VTEELTILVLREGTEGLSTEPYADLLRARLPDHEVRRASTPREERSMIADADVVTGRGIDSSLVEEAEELRLFACSSAGVGHVPVETLRDHGVVVTNGSGVHAHSIAEQVLGYVLTFVRNLHVGRRLQDRREWRRYQADQLAGKTVTVVGLGSIGTAVVQRLQGFEVSTVGIRYTPSKGGPTDEVYGFDEDAIHEALCRTDYLVLASPLSETTRGLIGRAELVTLPPEAIVVNVGRGKVLDTDALLWALRRNLVGGAALDVTDPEPLPEDHPLWNFENVLVTPHMGGHSPTHWERVADILVENVRRVTETGEFAGLRNQVAPPDD
jgi:phosphoglycerate dehydrogenase-like enzyme